MSWLVVKGRIHEAVQQYKFVAKINNREFKVRVETGASGSRDHLSSSGGHNDP